MFGAIAGIGRVIAGAVAGDVLLAGAKKVASKIPSVFKLPTTGKLLGGAGAGAAFQIAADGDITPATLTKGAVSGVFPLPYIAGAVVGGVSDLYTTAKNVALTNPGKVAIAAGAAGLGTGLILGGRGEEGMPQGIPMQPQAGINQQQFQRELEEDLVRGFAGLQFRQDSQFLAFENELLRSQLVKSTGEANVPAQGITQRVTISGPRSVAAPKKKAKKKPKPKPKKKKVKKKKKKKKKK